uniref:Uncharacterized protein n=1 Tax=Plectus sambesii TaxID=2011161 RepID=A0A914XRT6_9BILA
MCKDQGRTGRARIGVKDKTGEERAAPQPQEDRVHGSYRRAREHGRTPERGGQQVSQTSRFKYLGSVIAREGGAEEDVKARTASGWLKWRATFGVLCDPRMPRWLKGKVYCSVVRPALLYGSECWTTTKKDEQRMKTTEMRMLRWMCGLTRLDRVRNEVVRRMVGVAEITGKMQEGRLRWFGHVTRRPEDYIGNITQKIEVEGRRPRGWPKKRWSDTVAEVLRAVAATPRDAHD